jgi:DNA invertase Pin-like site-specific DNA recombinase
VIYGYARVSSKGQALYGNSLDEQEKLLKENGATVIYKEAFTGTKKDRPQLNQLLSELKSGDTVVVAKLDRIARSTKSGIEIIDEINAKGCKIHILNMGIFDDTPTGKLLKNVMLAFAEFERDMIVQRTQEGKAIAKEKNPNYHEGARKKELPDLAYYQDEVLHRRITVSQACRELGISTPTWYARMKERGNANG